MKAIVCEMCGSQDLVKQNGMYVCQNCGTKYDPEEAKKLMVEVSGAVKVDNTEKLKNYYQLARRAMGESNYVEAEKYYNLLKEEYPNDWEAHFYSLLCKAMQCKLGALNEAANSFSNSFNSVLSSIKVNVEESNRNNVCIQVYSAVKGFATSIHESGKSVWQQNPSYEHNSEGGVIYTNSIHASAITMDSFGNSMDDVFGREMQEISVKSWKDAITFLGDIFNTQISKGIPAEEKKGMQLIAEKIQHYEPEYKIPAADSFDNGVKAGCYVATAVYGSYDCPQVWTLRRYRDFTLAETWYGRAFIRTYYAVSPTLVRFFGETDWFKNMWKPTLDRMVKQLNEEGVANTPYQDRNW